MITSIFFDMITGIFYDMITDIFDDMIAAIFYAYQPPRPGITSAPVES